VEFRCPYTCPKATGFTIKVSSPCYWFLLCVNNREIHEDLYIPLFADYTTFLTASFDSILADMRNWFLLCVNNREIHEDLYIPLFAGYTTFLTASFDSILADMRNPLVRQLGGYIR